METRKRSLSASPRRKSGCVQKKANVETTDEGIRALDGLVLKWLGYAQWVARDMCGHLWLRIGESSKDIYQAAYEGLCEAAVRFDPKREKSFATYSEWWIKKYVRTELSNLRVVRLPEKLENDFYKLVKFHHEYWQKNDGHNPTDAECMKKLGLTWKCIKDVELLRARQVRSLEEKTTASSSPNTRRSHTLWDIVPQKEFYGPCAKTEIFLFRRRVEHLISFFRFRYTEDEMMARNCNIFMLFYGVPLGSDPRTASDIALRLSLSPKGVTNVLAKLRRGTPPDYADVWDILDRYVEEWRRDHGTRNQSRVPPRYGRSE